MASTIKSVIQRAVILLLFISVSSLAYAQTSVVSYSLDNVWLLPDISHPSQAAQRMTGIFEWTYEDGDFENGSGEFVEVYIPWYWSNLSELNITVEATSIEFSFNGNLHDRGLDITLFLLDPLSATQPAMIDTLRSQFQVEVGIAHEGHVISGAIIPDTGLCQPDLNNDGQLNFFDVSEFLSAFSASDPSADFTGDGEFNFFDVSAFLVAFAAGCP